MSTLVSTSSSLVSELLAAADHFDALGLSRAAPSSHITSRHGQAFRRRALLCHPDKCSDPRATAAFAVLSEALELEEDPEKHRAREQGSSAGERE